MAFAMQVAGSLRKQCFLTAVAQNIKKWFFSSGREEEAIYVI
jgi:hypothetical protein